MPVQAPEKNGWDMETDVVVAGGGLAGYCAAHAAAEAVAQVLLLEKQPEIGGSSVLSAGILALARTDMQKAAGIDDSPRKLLADLKMAAPETPVTAYAWPGRWAPVFATWVAYMSGSSLGKSINFGKIAGANAARA